MKTQNLSKINRGLKIIFFGGWLFLTASFPAQAQPNLFEAPWRGFDTGIIGNGFGPVSFAVGDLDGDADADALVGNSFLSPGIAVLKNRGDGTFDLPVSSALPEGETIGEVALSDFDRDGDLDAFATIHGTNDELAKIVVWRNAGDGSFATARVEFPTGQAPYGIWVADFTGDTFPDVVTANWGYLGSGNTISLLRHNGQTGAAAAFLAPVNYAAGAAPLRLAAADVNGDNRLDLAVGHIQTNPSISVPVSILLNGGDGNFAAPFDYESAPGARQFTAAVTFGDLDNDGDADLIGGGLYQNGSGDNGAIIVRRNNGAGAFGNHEIYLFPDNVDRPRKLTVADITGDGFADILAASPTGRTTDGWSLLKSNGTGGFLPAVRYEASQQTLDVKAADVDGDGDLDVATLAQSSAAVTIHKNLGSGVFRIPTRYNVSLLTDAVESADIDNDGDIDIVVNGEVSLASSTGGVKILKNNGDGTFASAIDYTSSRNFGDMKLRDINGDGFVDLIFAPDRNYPRYHLGTALNNGNGTFAPTVVYPLNGCGKGTIDAFDFDSDGDRDLVFTEEQSCQGDSPQIYILRNDGNQNFFQMPSLIPPGLPHGLAIADVTGDGKADIITAVSGSMGVFPGNGNLTFNAPILSTSGPFKFTTADFNNDGKLDLGMIMPQNSFGTDLIGTALGNGNGTFQAVRTQTGSSVAESLRISFDLKAADFNGDGKIDLLIFNVSSNDVSLFINAGDGSLLPHQRYGIGSNPNLGTAADFDRDGKIDIAAAIALPPFGFPSAVVILRNITSPTPTAASVTVGGRVTTAGNNGLNAVIMTLSGGSSASTVTNPNGDYSFTVGAGRNYTVTPFLPNYSFTPPTASFNNVMMNQLGNFTAASCSSTIDPTSSNVAATASSGAVTITTTAGCNWNAASNAAWLTVTSASSGVGNGTANYSVAANTGAQRSGTISIAGQTFTVAQAAAALSYEADVTPRSTGGDGVVDATDLQQIERFAVGSGRPFLSNEFQRADCAPRATGGDGQIDATDLQIAELFSVGIGGRPLAHGPTPTPTPMTNAPEGEAQGNSKESPAAPRTLTVESTSGSVGNTVTVDISVEAFGDEFGYTFSIDYDSTKLMLTGVATGGIPGETITTNIDAMNPNPDPLGLSVRFGGGAIPANGGVKQVLVRLTFQIIAGAGTDATVNFASSPSNQATTSQGGTPLPTSYINGMVTILRPTAATTSISGRVKDVSGAGIGGVAVAILNASSGETQTTLTNAEGVYRFEDLAVGVDYIITPRLARHSFTPSSKSVSLVEELTETDFTAYSKKSRRRL